MGRIFLWASHAEQVVEFQQAILLRDRILSEVRSRGCEVFAVPNDISLSDSIRWINDRSLPGDIALAIEISSDFPQETSIFYIANNIERKKHAELVLLSLVRSFIHIDVRGSQPDTLSPMGRLAFCRQVNIPSLLIKIAFGDRGEKDECDRTIIVGLTDGLIAWSQDVFFVKPIVNIDIKLNSQSYEEQGILVDGNAYIPIDLGDRLGIDLTQSNDIYLIRESGIVYLPAIALRDYNLSVSWDNLSQTVILRSLLSIHREQLDRIMGQGQTSEVQMMMFLNTNHENALKEFPDLPKIYREEGIIEGVNYDIAFSQMCLETDFLRFRNNVLSSWNNFANLGLLGSSAIASFTEPRLGVRSHIQHLKAYASIEPLVQPIIDSRFHLVRRGVASHVSQLSGRWSADLHYGDKIMAILKRLYESAKLL
jgi:hypothetical protein